MNRSRYLGFNRLGPAPKRSIICATSHNEIWKNNRSVMQLHAVGCTGATMMLWISSWSCLKWLGNLLNNSWWEYIIASIEFERKCLVSASCLFLLITSPLYTRPLPPTDWVIRWISPTDTVLSFWNVVLASFMNLITWRKKGTENCGRISRTDQFSSLWLLMEGTLKVTLQWWVSWLSTWRSAL